MSKRIALVGNIGRTPVSTTLPIVTVGETALHVIEYRGQRVVTLAQVDTVHRRPKGTARRNFNVNRQRLVAGEDFFEIEQADEIRSLGLARPQGGSSGRVILLAQNGYLMLVKSFTDELAWQVQRTLVTVYFRHQQAPEPAPAPAPAIAYSVGRRDSLTLEQSDKLRHTLREAAQRMPIDQQGAFMARGWSKLKSHFRLGKRQTYREIPQHEFTEALSIVERHVIEYQSTASAAKPAAISYTLPNVLDALLAASNALAQMAPVLAEIALREPANDPDAAARRKLR